MCPSPARQEKSWEGSRCGTGQGICSSHTQAAQFTPCRVRTAKTTQRNRARSQTAPLPGRKGQTGGLQQHKHHPMSIKTAPGEEQPRPDSRAAAPAVGSQVPKRVSFSHQNPQRFEVPSRKPCRTHCGVEEQQVPGHKRLHHRHCVAKNRESGDPPLKQGSVSLIAHRAKVTAQKPDLWQQQTAPRDPAAVSGLLETMRCKRTQIRSWEWD